MSKEKVKQQLKSIYDEKGLLGLQYLSNLKSNDPSLYHQVLSSYGRMSHAFQDAFNFSFPIPLDVLDRNGVIAEIHYEMAQDSEKAKQLAETWGIKSYNYELIQRQFRDKKLSALKLLKNSYNLSESSLNPIERRILNSSGINIKDLMEKREDIISKYQKLLDEKGLEAVLNVPTDFPELNKAAKKAQLAHPKILEYIGLDKHSLRQCITNEGIEKEAFRLFLIGEFDDADKLARRYKIPHYERNSLFRHFELKRIHYLNEDSGISGSSLEDALNEYFHNFRKDGWYLIHRHHVMYKHHDINTERNFRADFEIGPFLIEAVGLEGVEHFPLYTITLEEKKRLALENNVPLIIIKPEDIKRKEFIKKLEPIHQYIQSKGIESIIPEKLFDFSDVYNLEDPNNDYSIEFFNQTAWWRRSNDVHNTNV